MTPIALVVISDGRTGYLLEAIASLEAQVKWPFVRKVIVDDSGILQVRLRLQQEFPDYEIVAHDRRQGLAAAVNTGWRTALATDARFVFHLEQDFTFNGRVHLDELVALLWAQPDLANVVLKRDPYSPDEKLAGDFMRLNRELYEDCTDGTFNWVGFDALFSLNPSLIRRAVIEQCGPFDTEGGFAERARNAGWRFAFYGKTTDPPRVTHIGTYRAKAWKP